MRKKLYIHLCVIIMACCMTCVSRAQNTPTIDPIAVFASPQGTQTLSEYTGSAPLKVTFKANTKDLNDYKASYEWRFYREQDPQTPYMVRREEETTLTFTQSGVYQVRLYAMFVSARDTIRYQEEFWKQQAPIMITITESRLEMPNAFTPNNDGINDIYKPKEGYSSLLEFKATIFNRWGQKLYEWNDPAKGWDGTYKGRKVNDGVYFVVVRAKGSDGKIYDIRKDVNLLTKITQGQ